MNSIVMINRLPPPGAGHPRSATARAHAFVPPAGGERFDEILPLIDFVPEAGPPVLFILGPWLCVVLMLIGPFLVLVTLVLAAVIVVAVAGTACALPYLLVHHLRKLSSHHPARQPFMRRHHGPIGVGLTAQRSAGRLFSCPAAQPAAVTDHRTTPQSDVTSTGV